MIFMQTNSSHPGKYAAPRRRRRRRRSYRVLYVLNFALLILAAVCTLSHLGRHASAQATEDAPYTTGPRDTSPPVISGVHDFVIYAGDAVSYLSGVRAQDDLDPAPELTVDSSAADLSTPGSYTVTYTAMDEAGNRATATAALTVLEKREGYTDLDTIHTAVDDVLYKILNVGMSPREQVEAIYRWAHSSLSYGGHSDRTDWRQTGYRMLLDRRGDCYGYFAVTKLMFERLGIPNLDVVKVRNFEEDSDHFWSLVSVDGGETYYHFDATPRIGQTESFCLVTDAFLDAYSAEHKNCFNRDTSLYPATPEE